MAEIINLRSVRKARKRNEAEQKASENRARFGRTKAEKARDRADAERLSATLESARRDGED